MEVTKILWRNVKTLAYIVSGISTFIWGEMWCENPAIPVIIDGEIKMVNSPPIYIGVIAIVIGISLIGSGICQMLADIFVKSPHNDIQERIKQAIK